jgi:hypothetical protein
MWKLVEAGGGPTMNLKIAVSPVRSRPLAPNRYQNSHIGVQCAAIGRASLGECSHGYH